MKTKPHISWSTHDHLLKVWNWHERDTDSVRVDRAYDDLLAFITWREGLAQRGMEGWPQ